MELPKIEPNTKFQHSRKESTLVERATTNKTCKTVTSQKPRQNETIQQNFSKTTEIIAKRIINKELQYRNGRDTSRKSTVLLKKPDLADKIKNVVVKRILNIQMEEIRKETNNNHSDHRNSLETGERSNSTRTNSYMSLSSNIFELPDAFNTHNLDDCSRKGSNTTCFDSKQFVVSGSNKLKNKSYVLPNCKFVSTDPTPGYTVENKAVQVSLDTNFKFSFGVQTDQSDFVTISSVQACVQHNLAGKKLQTRIFKTIDNETDPLLFRSQSKSTNTPRYYYVPVTDRHTQLFQYLSDSELFCLDWVNKYVFPIDLTPMSIIIDQKVRDVSEMGTKSTLFSDSKTLRTFQISDDEPCCAFCP